MPEQKKTTPEPEKKQNAKANRQANKKHAEPPVWEWFAAAVGFILVAGTIGFLIYSAVTEANSPPKLTVKTDSVTALENGWLVKFSLYNDGENNAAEVVVEGKISEDGKDAETSSVTIDYAPSHSRREGALLFTKEPKEENFQIRALGYQKP
jgi:uncharacterized protein (TIGR02588 family)